MIRLAFSGASGTGKSTLAEHFAKTLGLPTNPIGARSVAQAMGFETPYDVDRAGKRAEFQRRLVNEKIAWEAEHESFVVDRTTVDNLTYTVLHDCRSVDEAFLADTVKGMSRYTHIVYCPIRAFCNPGGDPNRVQSMVYHELYEVVCKALHVKYGTRSHNQFHWVVTQEGIGERVQAVKEWLESVPEENWLFQNVSSSLLRRE